MSAAKLFKDGDCQLHCLLVICVIHLRCSVAGAVDPGHSSTQCPMQTPPVHTHLCVLRCTGDANTPDGCKPKKWSLVFRLKGQGHRQARASDAGIPCHSEQMLQAEAGSPFAKALQGCQLSQHHYSPAQRSHSDLTPSALHLHPTSPHLTCICPVPCRRMTCRRG